MKVIGLGHHSSKFAKNYAEMYEYDYIEILSSEVKTPQAWEEEASKRGALRKESNFKKQKVTIFLDGIDNVVGLSLILCEKLFKKKNEIRIVYLIPRDILLQSASKRRHEVLIRNVLQEYALTGHLEEITLIDLNKVAKAMPSMPATKFEDELVRAVTTAYYSVSLLKEKKPYLGNLTGFEQVARVSTIGMVDLDTGKEVKFYDLKYAREKVYFVNVNQEVLDREDNLLEKIFELLRKNREFESEKLVYGVYVTEFESKYCYSYHRTSANQSVI